MQDETKQDKTPGAMTRERINKHKSKTQLKKKQNSE
jgi:hypothetical protein